MEYQLKLLKIFDNEGFSKVVDLLDELLSNEEILLNFLILNMNNLNNIKYLCNYLKKDIHKYFILFTLSIFKIKKFNNISSLFINSSNKSTIVENPSVSKIFNNFN